MIDHKTRLSSLEASGGVPDPVVVGAVHGSGTSLTLRAGSTNVRVEGQDTTTLANFGLVENFLGVDEELYIDDVSGSAAGLKTNAVSARPGDTLLTVSGGSAGLRAEGAVEITGVTTGTEAVFATSVASRLISVTRGAAGGVVGAVLKNTAGTGFARLQLDANNSTGLVRLEAASAGGCTLDASNQEIWLQTCTSGAAPLG